MLTRIDTHALPPQVSMEVDALVPWPEDAPGWLADALADQEVGGYDDLETLEGWPLTVFEVAGGYLAAYRFLDWGGLVRVRCPPELRPVALRALASGRPDFRGKQALCLADVVGVEAAA